MKKMILAVLLLALPLPAAAYSEPIKLVSLMQGGAKSDEPIGLWKSDGTTIWRGVKMGHGEFCANAYTWLYRSKPNPHITIEVCK